MCEKFWTLSSLVFTNINEDAIINGRSEGFFYNPTLGVEQHSENIKGISAHFIESQTFEWLHKFYKWLSETKHRKELSTTQPIFLDQNGNAVAAFDDEGQRLILFLPVENIEGYTFVHPELLKNSETQKFIADIGIKQPSISDQIYNIILPQYERGGEIDTDSHFMLFFTYYCKCPNGEINEFINSIKQCEFLTYYNHGDPHPHHGRGSSMYLPTKELTDYFETKKDVRFIALDEYQNLVGREANEQLMSFLTKLGIKKEISIVKHEIDYASSGRHDLPYRHSTRETSWTELVIEGCTEIMKYILDTRDERKSVVLWNSLLRIIEVHCNKWVSLESLLSGNFEYFYYSKQYIHFTSSTVKLLREQPWLQDINGNFVIPSELHLDTISEIYDTNSDWADSLMSFLGISKNFSSEDDNKEDDCNLTDTQREKIAFADKVREYGIEDEADLAEFQEFRRQKEAEKNATEQRQHDSYEGVKL